MNFHSNKLLKYACSSFAVVALFISTLVSSQLAFALRQDCGPHRIELCQEHNNSHLVKTHIENSHSFSDSNTTSSSHDSSHQIEIDDSSNAIVTKQVTEHNNQIVSITFKSELTAPSNFEDKHLYSSLDPPDTNIPLLYLKTVRLII